MIDKTAKERERERGAMKEGYTEKKTWEKNRDMNERSHYKREHYELDFGKFPVNQALL